MRGNLKLVSSSLARSVEVDSPKSNCIIALASFSKSKLSLLGKDFMMDDVYDEGDLLTLNSNLLA